jgi:hypothetical protein
MNKYLEPAQHSFIQQSVTGVCLSEKKIGKTILPHGEVAEMFGVNTSLIRFYENEFDIIKPHRNKKGNRLFTQNDVDSFH